MPTWTELEHKTGRRKQEILTALDKLKEEGFIRWDHRPELQHIRILEGWEQEREQERPYPSASGPKGDIKYWTQY